ncbi:hypothetical protein Godav_001689 [Gossypium davidsonii]|uniref:Uncharacterized protein n=1 Tax=Gossypium davidsonii TaxID=34287 RepID=A0A7J8T3S7_GOSDV|nr:hypothetical protein [Gossypium davidsonii]
MQGYKPGGTKEGRRPLPSWRYSQLCLLRSGEETSTTPRLKENIRLFEFYNRRLKDL